MSESPDHVPAASRADARASAPLARVIDAHASTLSVGAAEGLAATSSTAGGPILTAIKARRVTRAFRDDAVPEDTLRAVLEAARWSPSGGNRRLNLYVAVRSPLRLRLLRAVAPGILGSPPAVVALCLDTDKMREIGVDDRWQNSRYVDIGTAAQNMLLAAHALGLGACPVMSFHRGAVQVLLDLPLSVEPIMLIAFGFPQPSADGPARPRLRLPSLDEVVHWERYTAAEPANG